MATSLAAVEDGDEVGVLRVSRQLEADLAACGLPHTLLRHALYTENWTGWLGQAVQYGALMNNAGDGKLVTASRGDLAEAAAVVLAAGGGTADGVTDSATTLVLTGDELWSMPELAAAAAEASGRDVAWVPRTAAEMAEFYLSVGFPGYGAEIVADIDDGVAAGRFQQRSGDLARLLGRAPRTMQSCVADTLRA